MGGVGGDKTVVRIMRGEVLIDGWLEEDNIL